MNDRDPTHLRIPSSPVERVTTYGGPKDSYRKMVDEFRLDENGILHVNRSVYARGYVDSFNCTVSFVRAPWWRRAWAWWTHMIYEAGARHGRWLRSKFS